MPITAAEYSGDIPRNFLEALVPESPQARDEAMRLHHADRQAHLICCKPSDSMPPAHYGCPPTRTCP
ncbi:MAG: hypothetical protein V8Q74_05755 [Bifidobacterium longum]